MGLDWESVMWVRHQFHWPRIHPLSLIKKIAEWLGENNCSVWKWAYRFSQVTTLGYIGWMCRLWEQRSLWSYILPMWTVALGAGKDGLASVWTCVTAVAERFSPAWGSDTYLTLLSELTARCYHISRKLMLQSTWAYSPCALTSCVAWAVTQ